MSERLMIHHEHFKKKCGDKVTLEYVEDCPACNGKRYVRQCRHTHQPTCYACPYLLDIRRDYVACLYRVAKKNVSYPFVMSGEICNFAEN